MITLAAAQAAPRVGEIVANCHLAATLVTEAAAGGATLVVFPELFLCGYDLEHIRRHPEECDLTADDPRLEALQVACRDTRTAAVVGASVTEATGRSLAALIIDASGAVRDRYAKRNLWGPEQDLFVPGDAEFTLELLDWRLSIGICAEVGLPEHARAAAGDGAMVYLTPSCNSDYLSRLPHPARARENGMYVVYANQVGSGFSGHSAIYAPNGQTLGELDAAAEGVALATLNRAAIDEAAERLSMIAHRSPAPSRVQIDLA